MSYPTQTFPDFNSLLAYINSFIVTNGNGNITGVEMNDVVNGLLSFIEKSPLNYNKAQIISGGGNVVANNAVVVIKGVAPDSLEFGNNIYNQFIFINTTDYDVPLASGDIYYDINLNTVDFIPAKSIVNIVQASNYSWIVASLSTQGNTETPKRLMLIVGEDGAPNAGDKIWQNDNLIGLGGIQGRIAFQVDLQTYINFGNNSNCTFDNLTGTVDITPNEFQENSSIEVDLLVAVGGGVIINYLNTQNSERILTESGNYIIL